MTTPHAAMPAIRQSYESRFAPSHQGRTCPLFWSLNPQSAPRPATQICWPIISGIKLPDVPVLTPTCFVGDSERGEFQRATFRHEHLAPGVTPIEMHDVAWRNLCRRPASWLDMEEGILMCSPDLLAAERIVDPTFTRAAASELAGNPAHPLVAIIPRRGVLIVGTFTDVAASALARMGAEIFASAGATALSPWLYLIVDGRVNTILEATA